MRMYEIDRRAEGGARRHRRRPVLADRTGPLPRRWSTRCCGAATTTCCWPTMPTTSRRRPGSTTCIATPARLGCEGDRQRRRHGRVLVGSDDPRICRTDLAYRARAALTRRNRRDAVAAARRRRCRSAAVATAAAERGEPWPLGAHWDGDGVNFAVFSAHAQAIELCLFDARTAGSNCSACRCRCTATTSGTAGSTVPAAGLIYGLRARGPWKPERGHLFNPAQAAARSVCARDRRQLRVARRYISPPIDSHPQPADPRDNAATALKARVVDERAGQFDWEGDQPPRIALRRHRDLRTAGEGIFDLNPAVAEPLRGSYAGLADPASLAHLKRLGVTAVELLPVHYHLDEQRLAAIGLSQSLGLQQHRLLLPRSAIRQRAPTVPIGARRIPRDGQGAASRRIEVILDVVYNHTAESDEHGPSLSFRGLDNHELLPPPRRCRAPRPARQP